MGDEKKNSNNHDEEDVEVTTNHNESPRYRKLRWPGWPGWAEKAEYFGSKKRPTPLSYIQAVKLKIGLAFPMPEATDPLLCSKLHWYHVFKFPMLYDKTLPFHSQPDKCWWHYPDVLLRFMQDSQLNGGGHSTYKYTGYCQTVGNEAADNQEWTTIDKEDTSGQHLYSTEAASPENENAGCYHRYFSPRECNGKKFKHHACQWTDDQEKQRTINIDKFNSGDERNKMFFVEDCPAPCTLSNIRKQYAGVFYSSKLLDMFARHLPFAPNTMFWTGWMVDIIANCRKHKIAKSWSLSEDVVRDGRCAIMWYRHPEDPEKRVNDKPYVVLFFEEDGKHSHGQLGQTKAFSAMQRVTDNQNDPLMDLVNAKHYLTAYALPKYAQNRKVKLNGNKLTDPVFAELTPLKNKFVNRVSAVWSGCFATLTSKWFAANPATQLAPIELGIAVRGDPNLGNSKDCSDLLTLANPVNPKLKDLKLKEAKVQHKIIKFRPVFRKALETNGVKTFVAHPLHASFAKDDLAFFLPDDPLSPKEDQIRYSPKLYLFQLLKYGQDVISNIISLPEDWQKHAHKPSKIKTVSNNSPQNTEMHIILSLNLPNQVEYTEEVIVETYAPGYFMFISATTKKILFTLYWEAQDQGNCVLHAIRNGFQEGKVSPIDMNSISFLHGYDPDSDIKAQLILDKLANKDSEWRPTQQECRDLATKGVFGSHRVKKCMISPSCPLRSLYGKCEAVGDDGSVNLLFASKGQHSPGAWPSCMQAITAAQYGFLPLANIMRFSNKHKDTDKLWTKEEVKENFLVMRKATRQHYNLDVQSVFVSYQGHASSLLLTEFNGEELLIDTNSDSNNYFTGPQAVSLEDVATRLADKADLGEVSITFLLKLTKTVNWNTFSKDPYYSNSAIEQNDEFEYTENSLAKISEIQGEVLKVQRNAIHSLAIAKQHVNDASKSLPCEGIHRILEFVSKDHKELLKLWANALIYRSNRNVQYVETPNSVCGIYSAGQKAKVSRSAEVWSNWWKHSALDAAGNKISEMTYQVSEHLLHFEDKWNPSLEPVWNIKVYIKGKTKDGKHGGQNAESKDDVVDDVDKIKDTYTKEIDRLENMEKQGVLTDFDIELLRVLTDCQERAAVDCEMKFCLASPQEITSLPGALPTCDHIMDFDKAAAQYWKSYGLHVEFQNQDIETDVSNQKVQLQLALVATVECTVENEKIFFQWLSLGNPLRAAGNYFGKKCFSDPVRKTTEGHRHWFLRGKSNMMLLRYHTFTMCMKIPNNERQLFQVAGKPFALQITDWLDMDSQSIKCVNVDATETSTSTAWIEHWKQDGSLIRLHVQDDTVYCLKEFQCDDWTKYRFAKLSHSDTNDDVLLRAEQETFNQQCNTAKWNKERRYSLCTRLDLDQLSQCSSQLQNDAEYLDPDADCADEVALGINARVSKARRDAKLTFWQKYARETKMHRFRIPRKGNAKGLMCVTVVECPQRQLKEEDSMDDDTLLAAKALYAKQCKEKTKEFKVCIRAENEGDCDAASKASSAHALLPDGNGQVSRLPAEPWTVESPSIELPAMGTTLVGSQLQVISFVVLCLILATVCCNFLLSICTNVQLFYLRVIKWMDAAKERYGNKNREVQEDYDPESIV